MAAESNSDPGPVKAQRHARVYVEDLLLSSVLKPIEWRVWIALKLWAGERRLAWPSVRSIGEAIGVQQSSARRGLSGLRAVELVTRLPDGKLQLADPRAWLLAEHPALAQGTENGPATVSGTPTQVSGAPHPGSGSPPSQDLGAPPTQVSGGAPTQVSGAKQNKEQNREQITEQARAPETLELLPAEPKIPPAVRELFDHWVQATGKRRPELNEDRQTWLLRGIKTYGLARAKVIISGMCLDPFNSGEKTGKKWLEPRYAFHKADRAEHFEELAAGDEGDGGRGAEIVATQVFISDRLGDFHNATWEAEIDEDGHLEPWRGGPAPYGWSQVNGVPVPRYRDPVLNIAGVNLVAYESFQERAKTDVARELMAGKVATASDAWVHAVGRRAEKELELQAYANNNEDDNDDVIDEGVDLFADPEGV